MLKMVGGKPPNQILVLGLSFRNLDEFENKPDDTYIRIKHQETGLPLDVVLASGDGFCAKGVEGKLNIFIVSLSMVDLRQLRQNPGKCIIDLKKEFYHLPMNICIFSGETEATMADQCQELIGPNTRVVTDSRLKN